MRRWQASALVALVAAPVIAIGLGSPGPARLHLNLGPGDAAYVSGFATEYEVRDGQASQWSRDRAALTLPLEWHGRGAWSMRFAPPPGGPVRIALRSPDGPLASLSCCRHRSFQRRAVPIESRARQPVALELRVEPENGIARAGLWMDWACLDVAEGGRVWLAGPACFRPPLTVMSLLLLLAAAGCAFRSVILAVAPFSLVVSVVLVIDPWLVSRLLGGVPETLGLAGVAVLLLRRSALVSPTDLPGAALLFALAFVPRAVAVNQPDFYYPDFMIHTRIAGLLQQAGLAVLADPAALLGRFQEDRGSTTGFPYSVVLHVPFALLGEGYDATMSVLRVAGAVLASLPVVFGFLLVRALGLSLLGVALLVTAATYPHWLARAMLPALFGHCLDLLLILWLVHRQGRVAGRRGVLVGALLVAGSQLGYSFGLPVTGVLVAALAFAHARARRGREALAALLMGLLGAGLAFVLYYRSFLSLTTGLMPTLGAAPTEDTSWLPVFILGPVRYLGALLIGCALLGSVALARRGAASGEGMVLGVWAGTVCGLLALKWLLPAIFRWSHEVLLLTPLLCLAAGEGLAALARRGPRQRVLAAILVAAAAAQGVAISWSSFAAALGTAR